MDFKIISISTLLTIVIILATASLGATANISNNDEFGYGYSYENPDDNDDDDDSFWTKYWRSKKNETITNVTNTTDYDVYHTIFDNEDNDALYNNGDGITVTPKNATYLPKEPPYNLITLAKVLSSFAAIFIIYKIITIFFIKKTPTYNTHTYPEKETEIDDFSDDNDGNKNL